MMIRGCVIGMFVNP
ncbi:hypothetical protein Ahy_A09g041415 isoform B [Arachis hypogaea]|uniref:Uncharacterized protein n=1 Tax=Arachis hypogaea TaxID=3818 RepID=A0A445BCP3_ARAHY|nr:hypothetical protein Ahy_A09g041415 isoform B [Arachis hypogaea]